MARRAAMQVINDMLFTRKELGENPGDFNNTMLRDDIFDTKSASNHIFTLSVIAKDTTSIVTSLAVKFIAENPKVLVELKREHEVILQNREDKELGVSWQEYRHSMTFTNMVINESLRLANLAPVMFRKAAKDVEIKGYTIPAGWVMAVAPTVVHYDPEIYENPLEFNPWIWEITKVIEDDEFAPARVQESYGTQTQGGTFFVEEYMVPRGGSASFSLYDTRGLNQNSSSDNTSMIEQWITRGVCHGEPVIWNSDSSDLRDRLIRESGTDDKPAVVMTHWDILSREGRAGVRVFIGELLGIPPDKQIFDIPESRDAATALTICDLLRYSLEHADKNFHFLPKRNFTISKVVGGVVRRRIILESIIYLALPLLLALSLNWIRFHGGGQNVVHKAQHKPPIIRPFQGKLSIDWHIARRRVWYDEGKVAEAEAEGEPSFDSHIARRLWYDEEKVAKAKPNYYWRTTRRLWYVE
ncbi:hypothetical protein AALP_AA6G186500 [Arabis alpina]|uniref:Uncharacterized protein n=1 Tax=Arabis alpina TaxID=50452 RepID=A0A087GQ42_ARAAL|nr:hypothetical protein AALP_AA6G186500 [Arabis alpina]